MSKTSDMAMSMTSIEVIQRQLVAISTSQLTYNIAQSL